MKHFNQALTDFFLEKAVNPYAKLCYDHNNQSYVISIAFSQDITFKKLNWEIILK